MAFVHALHLSCNNYTITTKLKTVKTNNNIEMQDECFSGQGERGRWGGEGICKTKKCLSRHGFRMGPKTYSIDIHVHIYLPVPVMQAQSVSV